MFSSNLPISPPALLQGSNPTVFECSQFITRFTYTHYGQLGAIAIEPDFSPF